MPGVPYEMRQAMSAEVIPRLQKKFDTPALLHKTLLVTGYPESALALKMADWEAALPANLHVAYLPNYSIIRLRLTGTGDDMLALDFAMNQQIDQLKALLGTAVVCDEDITVAEWLGRLLKSRGLTLATAESCTGGNIAHLITQVPGSSEYFKGTVVSYANEVKTGCVGRACRRLGAPRGREPAGGGADGKACPPLHWAVAPPHHGAGRAPPAPLRHVDADRPPPPPPNPPHAAGLAHVEGVAVTGTNPKGVPCSVFEINV